MVGTFQSWPREDIPQKDKNNAWLSSHLDAAENILKNYNPARLRMTKFFMGYNGRTDTNGLKWLTETYGQLNRGKYRPYYLTRKNIDLLHGEYLKRPLSATVTTINSDAVNNKIQQQDFIRGAMIARDELAAVKDKAGVDVMEGIPIPKDETEFEKMSFKDRCEDIAQIICDNQLIDLDVKKKLGDGFKDLEITNFAYFQIERNEKGDIELHKIDPRDAIFEAIEGDDYLEKSPIMGCRKALSVHQILLQYELTTEQRNTLNNARENYNQYIGADGLSRGYMSYQNGDLLCDVIHIVWKSVRVEYTKVVPKSKTQLYYDPTDEPLDFPMDAAKYEANKEYHDTNEKKGLYKVVTKYMEDEYEATRIGGIIDVNMRRTFFQKHSVDKPSKILNSYYTGYVHGRINGETISLYQIMEVYGDLFDIIKYQQTREVAKIKGKSLAIDRAGLGQNQKLTDMMYKWANDNVLEWDSSAAGNLGNRNLDPANMFKEIDSGLGDSFRDLVMVEMNVINSLNQITGISENRTGVTAASSTATAQQADISNSRTITEGLFYGYSGCAKRVVKAIVDASALSWAYFKTDKAEQILGSEKFSFLQSTIELAYRDYGVHIEDGSKYMEITQKLQSLTEVALNAKEVHLLDAMNIMLAETLAQKKQYLKSALDRTMQIAQQQMQAEQESAAQMQQQALQTQVQIAADDREDRQQQSSSEIILKGEVQKDVNAAKQEGDMHLQNQKIQGDIITKTQLPNKSI